MPYIPLFPIILEQNTAICKLIKNIPKFKLKVNLNGTGYIAATEKSPVKNLFYHLPNIYLGVC